VVAFDTVRRMVRSRTAVGVDKSGEPKESIPYAPAIVLGVWLALVPRG